MPGLSDYYGIGAAKVTGSDVNTGGAGNPPGSQPGNSLIIAPFPALLYEVNIFNGSASAYYLMLFDAVAVPINGNVSPTEIIAASAGTWTPYRAMPGGDRYNTGIVAVVSTTWGTANLNYILTLATQFATHFSGKFLKL